MNSKSVICVNSSTSACIRKFNSTWKSGGGENEGNIYLPRKRTKKYPPSLKQYFILTMSRISHFSTAWPGRHSMTEKKTKQLSEYTWQQLEGNVTPEVLFAPKTDAASTSTWQFIHPRMVRYLLRNVVGKLWMDQLTLVAAVLSAHLRDVQTVHLTIRSLHARFSAIFPSLGLETVDAWKPDLHLPSYLRGEIIPTDSQTTRQLFLKRYTSATKQVCNWLDTLPEAEKQSYRRFVLPLVNPLLIETVSKQKEVKQQQQEHRKAETEAVVPQFAALRAEAHFRYNRLMRLRRAYQQALEQVLPDHANLPLEFSYDEGDPPVERFHFKL